MTTSPLNPAGMGVSWVMISFIVRCMAVGLFKPIGLQGLWVSLEESSKGLEQSSNLLRKISTPPKTEGYERIRVGLGLCILFTNIASKLYVSNGQLTNQPCVKRSIGRFRTLWGIRHPFQSLFPCKLMFKVWFELTEVGHLTNLSPIGILQNGQMTTSRTWQQVWTTTLMASTSRPHFSQKAIIPSS